MTKKDLAQTPEFCRTIAIDKVPQKGYQDQISASQAERNALCKRFNLQDLKRLEATYQVVPSDHLKGFLVKGNFEADITQACVITLEPLAKSIHEEFEVVFSETAEEEEEEAVNPLSSADFEPITQGLIDIGELVSQLLGSTLDPYPRKEGVGPFEERFGPNQSQGNPFQNLKKRPPNPTDHG